MDKLDRKIVEMGEEVFRVYGLDPLSTKILSLLYFEPRELSMEELAEMTGYSLASISLKMSTLEKFWGVKRKKKTGSRKAYFCMRKDYIGLVEDSLRKMYEFESGIAKRRLPELIEEYREEANSDYELDKLNILENYCNQLADLRKLLELLAEKSSELRSDAAKKA